MNPDYHPASTTNRPVVLFATEARIPLDRRVVDLFAGEHDQPPIEAVNPKHPVCAASLEGSALVAISP